MTILVKPEMWVRLDKLTCWPVKPRVNILRGTLSRSCRRGEIWGIRSWSCGLDNLGFFGTGETEGTGSLFW